MTHRIHQTFFFNGKWNKRCSTIFNFTRLLGSIWFDHYHGQTCMLLEDYQGQFPVHFFLALLDRYLMPLQVKKGEQSNVRVYCLIIMRQSTLQQTATAKLVQRCESGAR